VSDPRALETALRAALGAAITGYERALGLPWSVHAKAGLFTANGRTLATTAASVASLGTTVRAIAGFFADEWAPGDAAITNDQDSGATHVAEMTLVRPLWPAGGTSGKPAVFAAIRAHIPDFGGWHLGGYSPEAIDRWAEGGRIVPVKVALAGAERREAVETLMLNSRTPALTTASVRALIATAANLAGMAAPLLAAPGFAAAHTALTAGESDAIARALAALSLGPHRASIPIGPLWNGAGAGAVDAIVERRNRLHVALAGPPVHALPINLTRPMVEDLVLAAIEAALALPPFLTGALRAGVDIAEPGPCLLDAAVPTPVGLGRETTGRALFAALVQALAAGGIAADADALWRAYQGRAIAAKVDATTGRVGTRHAGIIAATEAERARAP